MFLVTWRAELPEIHHISNSIQRNKHLTRHNGLKWAEIMRNTSMKHNSFLFAWLCFVFTRTVGHGKGWGKPWLVVSQLWCNVAVRRPLGPCPWPLHSVNSLLCSSGRALATQARSGTSVCSMQGSSEAAPLQLFRPRAQMPRHKYIHRARGEHRRQREETEHD